MSEKARRVQRVEKELRQIISSYLVKAQSGASQSIVTVTNVVASPDLRRAKVYVAVIGMDSVPETILKDTQSHAVHIQKEISRNMRAKFCPKLFFYNDDSIAMFAKIGALKPADEDS